MSWGLVMIKRSTRAKRHLIQTSFPAQRLGHEKPPSSVLAGLI